MSDSLESLMYFDDFTDDLMEGLQAIQVPTSAEPTPANPLMIPEEVELDEEEPFVPPTSTETKIEPIPEPKPEPDPKVDTNEESEGIKEYYNFLVANDMLIPDEDFTFDGTAASLSQAMQQSDVNRQSLIAQSLWQRLPEDFRPLLQYGLSGGTDVESFLKTYQTANLDVTKADLSDPATKDAVIREYYKQTTKFNDAKIDKHIAQLKERGDDAYTTEVYETAVALKDIQKTQREELIQQSLLQAQAAQQKAEQERQEVLDAIEKMDTTPQRRNMIKSFIYAPDSNSNSRLDTTVKSIIENKEHYAQLADILLDSYDPKTGFNLEGRFAKKGRSKAIEDIEKQLQAKFSDSKSKVSGSNSTSQTPEINWESIFQQQN